MAKIAVSSEWTRDERALVASAIRAAMGEIETQEKEARKTILYEAPCFQEWAAKRAGYDDLLDKLEGISASFLELNRSNYSEFVE